MPLAAEWNTSYNHAFALEGNKLNSVVVCKQLLTHQLLLVHNIPAGAAWVLYFATGYIHLSLINMLAILKVRIMFAALRCLSWFSFDGGRRLGRMLGTVLYLVVKKRRKVTQVNLRLCFPQWAEPQIERFSKQVFQENGIGLVEAAWGHYARDDIFRPRLDVIGEELLHQSLAKGKGVLLIGAHYTSMDLSIALFATLNLELGFIYRKHNNPLVDEEILKCRRQYAHGVERKDLRRAVKWLKSNRVLWVAPDQDLGLDNSVFVPFFGQCAATITSPAKLCRLCGCTPLLFASHRDDETGRYRIQFLPMEAFPAEDDTIAAQQMNTALESAINIAPEQYMWMHKRFKNQPDGNQKLYRAHGC